MIRTISDQSRKRRAPPLINHATVRLNVTRPNTDNTIAVTAVQSIVADSSASSPMAMTIAM
jgi:hypothetical protein